MDAAIPVVDESEPFDPQAVAEAWQAFIEGRPFPRTAVRGVVADSWQRVHDMGLDAQTRAEPLLERGAALAARIAANRELLISAEHSWQLLSESLTASDNVLIVADRSGVILRIWGNEEFVAAAARLNIVPGRDWSEPASGTNAIGTALVLGRPTIIRSAEHYCETAKIWDCAASPIRDLTDGSIVGVLDVTSLGDLSGNHTLALAITAAHQVEHALHSRELARSVQLLNWHRAAAGKWHGRPVLLLDGKARVIQASEAAQRLLAEHPLAFTLGATGPRLAPNQPARVLETHRYQPPPDLCDAAEIDDWQGGIVVIGVRQHTDGSQAGRADDPGASATHPAFRRIVTADPQLRERMRRAERMARANSPILLHGETGSGKELFALAIHECSNVAAGPFVAVNCGTLTRDLAASELLGYEAGAFTGASSKGRPGKFEQADGGTLFLDEIGELTADVQVHLLRVLQDNVVVRVGGNAERDVSVRVVAATHRDLEQDAADGRFRSDLLFRLRVLHLALPPLRERRGDIALLVQHSLRQMQATYGLGARSVSEDLLAILGEYTWPGNVRELHGLIESMYILSDRTLLTPSDLPDGFAVENRTPRERTMVRGGETSPEHVDCNTIVAEIERSAHNMTLVAKRLGISRSTLYRKMKHFGIAPRKTD